MLVAADQEVVAQGKQQVDVGVAGEAARASSANRACVSGGLSVNSSSNWSTHEPGPRRGPAASVAAQASGHVGILEARRAPAPPPRLPPPRGPVHGRALVIGARPGCAGDRSPSLWPRRDHPARTNDVFPAPEGPMRARSVGARASPTGPRLGLSAEEDLGVLFGEGRRAGIRAAGLDWPAQPPRARGVSWPASLPAEGVAEAVDRPDEAGLAGVVAQGLADGVHGHPRVDSETNTPGQTTSRIWARESALGPALHEEAQQLVGLGLKGTGRPERRSCRRSRSSSNSPN